MKRDKVTAVEFWTAFSAAAGALTPVKGLTAWSELLYSALHEVQKKFGFWCQCNAHVDTLDGGRGERLKIDLLWFSRSFHGSLSHDEAEWIPAAVAIEHENLWKPRERDVDHWKVSQVAVPLRVFIGYTSSAMQVDGAAQRLQDRESRWHSVANGETLIILGHGEMTRLSEFQAWWAPQGSSGQWQKLRGAHNEA